MSDQYLAIEMDEQQCYQLFLLLFLLSLAQQPQLVLKVFVWSLLLVFLSHVRWSAFLFHLAVVALLSPSGHTPWVDLMRHLTLKEIFCRRKWSSKGHFVDQEGEQN